MKKNVWAMAMVMTLTASMLGGCGSGGGTPNAAGGTSGGENGTAQGSASEENAGSTEEPYHLTMAYVGNEQADQQKVYDAINELTLKELNMTVDFIQLNFGDYANKLKLMLSGGDVLDVFPIFFDQAPSYVNNGQIVNLKDYIEDYGSGIVETIGEEAAYGAQINGFLYGLPAQKESNMLSGVVMRKDMVEKYGIDVESIKELSDLTPIFEKIHAGEPNMTCITGVNFVSNSQFYDQLSDGFGCLDMHGDPTKVVNYYETDTYMNICKIARSWYEAGYVLPDAATTTETSQNLMKAGNLFCYLSPIKPGFLIQEEANTNTELVTAYIGDTNWMATNNVHYFDWGIAQNSQDPAKAMEFLEFAYTNADFMNLLTWGIEGEHYVKVEGSDNVITFPEGVDGSNSPYHLNIGWELPNQFIGYVWEGNDADIWDQYKAFNDEAQKLPAFGFLYDGSAVQTQLTALSNVVNEYKKAIETGSVDPEAYIPKFNEALYEAGLQDVIDVKQEQYDAWRAENGK